MEGHGQPATGPGERHGSAYAGTRAAQTARTRPCMSLRSPSAYRTASPVVNQAVADDGSQPMDNNLSHPIGVRRKGVFTLGCRGRVRPRPGAATGGTRPGGRVRRRPPRPCCRHPVHGHAQRGREHAQGVAHAAWVARIGQRGQWVGEGAQGAREFEVGECDNVGHGSCRGDCEDFAPHRMHGGPLFSVPAAARHRPPAGMMRAELTAIASRFVLGPTVATHRLNQPFTALIHPRPATLRLPCEEDRQAHQQGARYPWQFVTG